MAFDYEKVKHWPIPAVRRAYTRRDTIRFALGIGCGMPGPLRGEEQKFIRDDAGLQALPMMAGVLNEGTMWTQNPATHIDWTQTVHAEESITVHQPLAVENELIAEHRVDEIYDKGPGKGALMYESRVLSAPGGAPVATLSVATFLRGNGGLGGSSAPSPFPSPVPTDRAPDGATYTGETLVVDVWKLSSGRAAFVVRSHERNVVVLKNGYVEYRD